VPEPGARFEHFPHGADIGVRGLGPTKAAAFEQAALAMIAAIADPATVAPAVAVAIDCAAGDDELLLTDWLNALIYEMATRRMLFARFAVRLNDGELHATAWGEAIDVERHQPGSEAKGATFTALKVAKLADGTWLAQCVVDV
jgi:tRNA nucleotidyltransferase (CCA-adding enzyme)